MKVFRYPENPLVRPADVKPSLPGYEVLCAFNAGAIEHNGEVLLLMRVAERPVCQRPNTVLAPVLDRDNPAGPLKVLEFDRTDPGIDFSDPRVIVTPGGMFLTTISHFRIARSSDRRIFTVDETPALWPDRDYEIFGIEDPRITRLGDEYLIVYKGVAPYAITQCLATTRDFVRFEKRGIIFCPENMDAMIFPEKIHGKYAALHRPMPRYMGAPNMWLAYSDDLVHWGEHKFLMGCSEGTWEGGRIGGGAVPFRTEQGWLEIYHAATTDERYCLGAVLLDSDNPEKVIAKSPSPILEPQADYEVNGFKNNVVFTCGAIVRGDTVSIYYGASDETMAGADLSVSEMVASLKPV